MTRTLPFLLLLAGGVAGQDAPLLQALGTSLETFEVRVRLEGVDHASAKGMAGSFAALTVQQHDVRRRFAELFRDEHLDVLRLYYAPELVRAQQEWYAGRGRKDYRCAVVQVDEDGGRARARLRRTWLEPEGRRREEETLLALVARDGGWWVESVKDQVPGQGLVERPLAVPPPAPEVAVPAPAAPDRKSPAAVVASLRHDVARLGAVRNRAAAALQADYLAIVEAYYGKAAAARAARAERPEQPALVLEVGEPEPQTGDTVRVAVLVQEKVPGSADLQSAVGQAAFDLQPVKDRWQIVAEYLRPQPDQPLRRQHANLGLIFLAGDSHPRGPR